MVSNVAILIWSPKSLSNVRNVVETVCVPIFMTWTTTITQFKQHFFCVSHQFIAHPTCLKMSVRMARRVNEFAWQCNDCRMCMKCHRSEDGDKLMSCDQCDRHYHIYCVGQRRIPEGKNDDHLLFTKTCKSNMPRISFKFIHYDKLLYLQKNGIVRYVLYVHCVAHDGQKDITIQI